MEKSMVFISGPRQVGKTTLAKFIANRFENSIYFNWDRFDHKKLFAKNPLFFEDINRKDESIPLVIFDEIHKYRGWKNYLKGVYDQFADDYKFLVLGSGMLDVYQKGGDSLAGRYLQFHLFPFTVGELTEKRRNVKDFLKNPISNFDINDVNITREIWSNLFQFGGFPEPFLKSKKRFYMKWIRGYFSQIVREDIRNFADIKYIDQMEVMLAMLPFKVGSPLSINNIAEDIGVSFGTVKEWLKLLEIFYVVFRISPWTKKISRAILKEKKLYLYNYPEVSDESFRFENMVALELLRVVYNLNEMGFGKFNLHYIRNKDKEEVDFLIVENNRPFLLIEAKSSEDVPSRSLKMFQNILNIPAVQLVNKENVFKYFKNGKNRILVVTAHRWLSSI
ncbi:MAG: ATP-binding protein [Caldiserica bacterium]|nr:MAG: ATP-binding protein [Caldisericota bacterium]